MKLAKPTAGQKINPCQVCKAKFSVSSNLQAAAAAGSLAFLGVLLTVAISAPIRSSKEIKPLAEKEWAWIWVYRGSQQAQMHNMHINLIAHSQVEMWNPTPECQNQIYPHVEVRRFFTAFSRVFDGLLTFLGSALFVYFCYNLQKPWRKDFQTTHDNFRSSKYRTSALTAAILQTGGTLTSSRQHFFLLVPHQM